MTIWMKRIGRGVVFIGLAVAPFCTRSTQPSVFRGEWPQDTERFWVGPDYWANRLQDWRVSQGRLECVEGSIRKPMRTVHLLTRRLGSRKGNLKMDVQTGAVNPSSAISPDAATGFLIGVGKELDYRAAALVHHSPGPLAGLFCGIDGSGCLFIRDFADSNRVLVRHEEAFGRLDSVGLRMNLEPSRTGYRVELSATPSENDHGPKKITYEGLEADRLIGGMALVSHPGSGETGARFWFKDWEVSGNKVKVHEDRHCGPILSAQYTLSEGIVKLTAQMMPLGKEDNDTVRLQVHEGRDWKNIAESKIIEQGYTVSFRIENWDDSKDTPYRLVYRLKEKGDSVREYDLEGIIRHNPAERDEMVVAAFTGNHNVTRPLQGVWAGVDGGYFPWDQGVFFPHADLVAHVKAQRPDVLFFSGDQVYEGASPTEADFGHPWLDYLYKWYLWCWAFRDLTADIPAVTIPDDHDVYHGNLWGCGGKATQKGAVGAEAQDSGGYKMEPDFVNMVQRTQTSHLPDPYDPMPADQGIGVYACDLNWGGISFAVVEDRKFKSAPKPLLPGARIWNGWAQNPDFDPKKEADVPGAVLLGDRQLAFLEQWAADWSHDTWMKVVLSQTLFCNVATLPEGSLSGSVIPSLPVLPPGAYAENDVPVADMDSNGWPPAGRNRALRAMRKGFAVHIAGDQHLGSTIQYGVDDWGDAAFAMCVPSVGNFWPRRWFPATPGKNRVPEFPKYTGDFEDGFGNKMTVHAVSNPHQYGKEPSFLHDLAVGYGIARFRRSTRDITFEVWPRWADPEKGGNPYSGWPVKVHQDANYGRKAVAYLPTLRVDGMVDPVVQIIDEAGDDVVYTLRIRGNSIRPKVFKQGQYTVRIGEPGTSLMKVLTHVQALHADTTEIIGIAF